MVCLDLEHSFGEEGDEDEAQGSAPNFCAEDSDSAAASCEFGGEDSHETFDEDSGAEQEVAFSVAREAGEGEAYGYDVGAYG